MTEKTRYARSILSEIGKLFGNVQNVAIAFHTMQYGSIRGISSDKELLHLPCRTNMQTNCGLTDCTGSRSENVFSLAGF